jgi:phage terminase small subunit
MNVKQERFANEYIIDYNATRAYIKAYNLTKDQEHHASVNGSKLLANTDIKAFILDTQRKRAENSGITAEFVLNGLRENHIKCSREEELTDKQGKGIGVYKFDANGSNKALELLGKHLQLFTDKVLTENINTNIEIKNMSDNEINDELKRLNMNE